MSLPRASLENVQRAIVGSRGLPKSTRTTPEETSPSGDGILPAISNRLAETSFFQPVPGQTRIRDVVREIPGATQTVAAALDPRRPVDVRPPFGVQTRTLPGGGTIGQLVSEGISRTIESPVRLPTEAVGAFAEITNELTGRPTQQLDLRFDPRRIGIQPASKGDTAFDPIGRRTVDIALELEEQRPEAGVINSFEAFIRGGSVEAIFDAFSISSAVTAASRSVLRRTGDDALNRSLQRLGIRNPDQLTSGGIKDAFTARGRALQRQAINEGWSQEVSRQQLNELGSATDIVLQRLRGVGATRGRVLPGSPQGVGIADINPQFSRLGDILDRTARTLVGTEPHRTGLLTRSAVRPFESPLGVELGLPGYRFRPGQAPAMGLSIREVEKVGGRAVAQKARKSATTSDFRTRLTPEETTALSVGGLTPETAFRAVQGHARLPSPTMAERSAQQAMRVREIQQLKEQGDFRALRQRIQDRSRFVAQGIRRGEINTKQQIREIQRELTDIIRENLRPDERGNLLPIVSRVQTPAQLQKELPNLYRRIADAMEKREVSKLRSDVRKELKSVKRMLKPDIDRRAPISIEAQDNLREVLRYSSMKMEEADDLLVELTEAVQSAEEISPEVMARMRMLRFASRDMGAQELDEFLADVRSTIKDGRTLAEVREFNRQAEIQQKVDSFSDAVTPVNAPQVRTEPRQYPGFDDAFLGRLRRWGDDWTNAILSYEAIADKITDSVKYPNAYTGPLYEYAKQHRRLVGREVNGRAISYDELNRGLAESFGYTPEQVNQVYPLLQQEKNIGTFTNEFGEEVTLTLTTDEAIEAYNLLKLENNLPTFKETMGWTDEMITSFRKSLTNEEKLYADYLVDEFLPQHLDGLDGVSTVDVYERRFGMRFQPIDQYFPINREIEKPLYLDFINQQFQNISTKPGQVRARVASKAPFQFRGATATMVKYVDDMEKFKHLSEYIDEARRVFNHPDFKEAVKLSNREGDKYLNLIDDSLQAIYRGRRKIEDRVRVVDQLKANTTTAYLGINPTQIPKQLSSVVTSMHRMPVDEWAVGFSDFFKNPVRNYRILTESPLLRERYRGSTFNQELAQAKREGWLDTLSGKPSLRNKIMFMTKYGDMGGILGSGWPVYRYERKQALARGLSEEEAHKAGLAAFEDNFSQTQTSAMIGDLGPLQRGNSWGASMAIFMNAPIQYNRFALAALRKTVRGKKLTRSNLKMFYIFGSLLPTLFGLATHPQDIPNMFSSDERGERARRRLMLNQFVGGSQYHVIAGSMLYNVGRKVADLPTFRFEVEPTALNLISETGKITADSWDTLNDIIENDEVTAEDLWEALTEFEEAASLLTGVPIENTADLARKHWGAITEGPQNMLKLFGYSDWALDSDLDRTPVDRQDTSRPTDQRGAPSPSNDMQRIPGGRGFPGQ